MQIISQEKILPWGLITLRESDLNGYCPKGVLVTFWKRAGFEGGERGNRPAGACPLNYISFFLNFLSFFLCFLSYLFYFLLLCFSFFTPWILCFSVLFSGHDKGPFIVPAVTNLLPYYPLIAFVWSGRTCRPPKVCDTYPRQTKAGLFHSSVYHSTSFLPRYKCFLSLSLKSCTQRFPLKLASFGWSIILAGRTSQKGLDRSRKIDLFPSPHHQTISPLPVTSGTWSHHVLYWLGTGWWCLGLARASLSDMSKSLPAAHAFAVIWRLSVCVFWPFYVGFSLVSRSIQGWALHFFGPLLIFFIFCNVELLFLP